MMKYTDQYWQDVEKVIDAVPGIHELYGKRILITGGTGMICSAVAEIHQVDRSLGMAKLFASGMHIGRDAMGTMATTLILAVAGTSLNMMLMIYSYDVSFQQLMNTDFVAIEIIQCIAGSVGIVCTVPLVALLSAAVFGKKTKK